MEWGTISWCLTFTALDCFLFPFPWLEFIVIEALSRMLDLKTDNNWDVSMALKNLKKKEIILSNMQ